MPGAAVNLCLPQGRLLAAMDTTKHAAKSRWEEVSALFDAALERPDTEREAFLARAGAPADVLDEVRQLLKAAQTAHAEAAGLVTGGGQAPTAHFQSLAEGTALGAWRLGPVIGRGGMGEVYRADRADGQYQQRAALKLIHIDSPSALLRFHRERQVLASLDHPHIAKVLDGGSTSDGRPYMVMEYVDGLPITRYAQQHRLNLEQRLTLFLQACEAVAYAHAQLVVHRDLKPANLLVDAKGQLKLLDFGIVKLLGDSLDPQTVTQAALTPIYAAPEQLAGEAIGTTADVYALGVLLFELLTGQPPRSGEQVSITQVIEAVMRREAPLASDRAGADAPVPASQLRGDLDAILARALRRDPGARYLSVEALAEDVQAFREQRPVRARDGKRAYRARRFLQRYAWQSAALGLVVLSLAGGLIASLVFAEQAKRSQWAAEQALQQARISAEKSARRAEERNNLVQTFLRLLGRAYEDVPGAQEVRQFLDTEQADALNQLDNGNPDAAPLLISLAELHIQRTNPMAAIGLLQPVIEHASTTPRQRASARALLGSAYLNAGQFAEAVEPLQQAVSYYSGQPGDEATYLTHLSLLAHATRDPARREQYLAAAAPFLRSMRLQAPVNWGMAGFLRSEMGFNLIRLDRVEEGIEQFRQALDAFGRVEGPTPANMSATQLNLAATLHRAGRLEEADREFEIATALIRRTQGPGLNLASTLLSHAILLVKLGRVDEALPKLAETEQLALRFDGEASSLRFLARNARIRALVAEGQHAAAIDTARETIEQVERLRPSDIATVGSSYYELANALAADGGAEAALQVLSQSDRIFEGLGERRALAMKRNNALREKLEASAAR